MNLIEQGNWILQESYTRGYAKITDKEMFQHLEGIDGWEWHKWKVQDELQLISRTPEIDEAINKTQQLIADRYISLGDPDYKLGDDCVIVNGMDTATLSWHNDEVEGYNVAVLLYFDDMDADTGGKVSFRHRYSNMPIGSIYPKKYNILFLNHTSRFEHKVDPMKIPVDRRVAMFNYNVNKRLTG